MREFALANARIVLADEVIEGSVLVRDGVIAEIDAGTGRVGEDVEGDYVVPGLVELHTDHFENHYRPRPGVTWNALAALQSHDAQVAGAGITTVFDAVRIGSDPETGDITEDVAAMVEAVAHADADDRLRADHHIHLRCELATPDVAEHFDAHCANPIVGLASLMDHTPGARQYVTLDHYVAYYQKKMRFSDAEMTQFIADRQAERDKYADANRAAILKRGREIGLAFASHDDATVEHVDEAVRDGMSIAEFPTTMDAARACHAAGLAVLMGAPNVVRGKSHNGNISAAELAKAGVLDVLSSDYVPFALMYATFLLPERADNITLPQAVQMVSKRPAEAAHLNDRGEIAVGKRADLVRVRRTDPVPVVRGVWRQGKRVS
ncbi:MAG: alpha-D-ribose 1-methylphosphonate 5-triphosphate diphosphatase [Devosia sp.]|uniref:alpha-D-ribose 1-methylphosphonate 5-triphosphate diphosphatase n=1 Tax=Devosia sp. TaxID=1871048 RepID=UPI001AC97679|nr:alpha-D-ribose 1-methylphosphonate 5-triphosphate diphosphatase [Devosia sp.]MBN9314818.1 alpha-D-ribose 1-methylphosphonate 5-triphosphate diphosphatase [Devosia sp.]